MGFRQFMAIGALGVFYWGLYSFLTGQLSPPPLTEWWQGLLTVAMTGLLSILVCLAAAALGDSGNFKGSASSGIAGILLAIFGMCLLFGTFAGALFPGAAVVIALVCAGVIVASTSLLGIVAMNA
jgi:hypothetical protein